MRKKNDQIVKLKELGIKAKPEEFVNNPGLVYIAKICLNSLWGKFGQNTDYPQCDYINDYNKFIGIILNDKVNDLIIKQVNEKL